MINTGVVEPQTVLQVGHHGSKYSVGENSYGHPSEETMLNYYLERRAYQLGRQFTS